MSSPADLPLFDALPRLRALPWRGLVERPTPVESCDRIAGYLGRTGVFMKRDDLASRHYGGNKVRRFEFVLADALARGKTRILTAGGIASTQAIATAVFGRQLGLPVRIVHFDQPVTRFAQKAILTTTSAGAELTWGGGYLATFAKTLWLRTKQDALIPPGASNALANIGYIDAVLELAEQVARGELPRPDVVVLPTGSSGTLAALALGFAHLGWTTRVVGVRITLPIACNRWTIGAITGATDRFLAQVDARWTRRRRDVSYELYGHALGGGYGVPTREAVEAIPRVRELIGVDGEVTYSGKALVGLRAIAHDPRFAAKTILLWNTLSAVDPPIAADAPGRVPTGLRWVTERLELADVQHESPDAPRLPRRLQG